MTELLRIGIRDEADVFAARQRARSVAGVVGLDMQDQVRVATALSETGRELVDAGGGYALFRVLTAEGWLEVLVTGPASWPPEPSSSASDGLTFAHRLMDEVVVEHDAGVGRVRMRKGLSARPSFDVGELGELSRRLALLNPPSPLEELRLQNQELLDALEEVRAKQEQLLAANTELEETNRGVLAMYGELSAELEETNRGVVALYAELDLRREQLQRASEAKSRFLANVSHELRTPANSLLGLCRLLLEDDADPVTADQENQLRLMASSAETLLALVNELLDLAKAESGRMDVRLEAVDVADVLAELEPVFRPLVPSADVELRFEDAGGLPTLETDRTLLVHILGNLVSNALKFTERGSVVVSAELADGGDVAISVSDTGIGIQPEHLDLVFEEFVQIPGPLQLRRGGTGLGLPYARQVAHTLGGTLTATSETGAGSVFTVRLPVRARDRAEAVVPQQAMAALPTKVSEALVVDDDAAFREVLRRMLDGLANRVVEASDGAEALARMEHVVPDIVFLDLRMPGVGGVEVLRRTQQDPRLTRVPVVVLTAAERHDVDGQLPARALFLRKSGLTRADVERCMAALL